MTICLLGGRIIVSSQYFRWYAITVAEPMSDPVSRPHVEAHREELWMMQSGCHPLLAFRSGTTA